MFSTTDELDDLERKVYDLKIDNALLQASVDRGVNGIQGPPGPKGNTGCLYVILINNPYSVAVIGG